MKPLAEQTHYEVLEVETSATVEAIEEAWRKMRRLLGPGSIATYSLVDPLEQQELLRRLDEARGTLVEPGSRRAYDRSLGLEVQEPETAEVRWVEAVVVEAGTEGDDSDVLELELDDVDVLEVFEATPGPIFGMREVSHGAAEARVVSAFELALAEAEDGTPGAEAPDALETMQGARVESDAGAVAEFVTESVGEFHAESDAEFNGVSDAEPAGLVLASDAPEAEEPEPDLPLVTSETHFSGELLRTLREASGLSLEEFAARTRIGVHHLVRVEEEAWSSLPERVFLRGILGNYARELRLDANRVCDTYLARKPR